MDVGGTWNGAAEVLSRDTFIIVITNGGDDVAFDLDLEVTLPRPRRGMWPWRTAADAFGVTAQHTGLEESHGERSEGTVPAPEALFVAMANCD